MQIQLDSAEFEKKIILYRVWCRIFFSQIANPPEETLVEKEKSKKNSDLHLHIPIFDYILKKELTLQDFKKQLKEWENYVYQLKQALLVIEQNKKFKINPLFLEQVIPVIKIIRDRINEQKQLCGQNDTETKILICKTCGHKNEQYMVRLKPRACCESCGGINLKKPQKNQVELFKCQKLLNKLVTFEQLKKQIEEEIQKNRTDRKKKQEEVESENAAKTKLELMYQKIAARRSYLTPSQQSELKKIIEQLCRDKNYIQSYFKEDCSWISKLRYLSELRKVK